MPTPLLSRVFWEHAAEITAGWSASSTFAVLILHVTDLLTDVPWYAVLSAAVIGALLGLCKALGSLKIQPDNGTGSILKRVTARR